MRNRNGNCIRFRHNDSNPKLRSAIPRVTKALGSGKPTIEHAFDNRSVHMHMNWKLSRAIESEREYLIIHGNLRRYGEIKTGAAYRDSRGMVHYGWGGNGMRAPVVVSTKTRKLCESALIKDSHSNHWVSRSVPFS